MLTLGWPSFCKRASLFIFPWQSWPVACHTLPWTKAAGLSLVTHFPAKHIGCIHSTCLTKSVGNLAVAFVHQATQKDLWFDLVVRIDALCKPTPCLVPHIGRSHKKIGLIQESGVEYPSEAHAFICNDGFASECHSRCWLLLLKAYMACSQVVWRTPFPSYIYLAHQREKAG